MFQNQIYRIYLMAFQPHSCRSYFENDAFNQYFLASSIQFGKCIDGKVNLFFSLMMYRLWVRVKYYQMGQKYAENLFRNKLFHKLIPNVCGTLYVLLQQQHLFQHEVCIFGSCGSKKPNSLIWFDVGHDFGIFKSTNWKCESSKLSARTTILCICECTHV